MQELYNSIIRQFCQITRSCKDAMRLCQSWGYNGFKRRYRRMARHFFNWEICLENELFDKYRMVAAGSHETMPYTPANFKDHFPQWDKFLKSNIDQLVGFSKQFLDQIGMENCILGDALSRLVKDYEKTGRWHKRFTESGFNPHDTHRLDDDLHEKEKCAEEKEMDGWKS